MKKQHKAKIRGEKKHLLLLSLGALGFDNDIAHPKITEYTINSSQLNNTLIQNLGFPERIKTVISYNGLVSKAPQSLTIQKLIQLGAKDEDLLCRSCDQPFSQSSQAMGLFRHE